MLRRWFVVGATVVIAGLLIAARPAAAADPATVITDLGNQALSNRLRSSNRRSHGRHGTEGV